MALLSFHSARRGFLGFLTYILGSDGVTRGGVIPAYVAVDSTGAEKPSGTSAAPLFISSVNGTGTAKGSTITAGGTAQTLAAANAARRSFTLQNRSTGDLWINETGSAAIIGDSASYQVGAGGTFTASTSQALSIIGATTGQAFTATEAV